MERTSQTKRLLVRRLPRSIDTRVIIFVGLTLTLTNSSSIYSLPISLQGEYRSTNHAITLVDQCVPIQTSTVVLNLVACVRLHTNASEALPPKIATHDSLTRLDLRTLAKSRSSLSSHSDANEMSTCVSGGRVERKKKKRIKKKKSENNERANERTNKAKAKKTTTHFCISTTCLVYFFIIIVMNRSPLPRQCRWQNNTALNTCIFLTLLLAMHPRPIL